MVLFVELGKMSAGSDGLGIVLIVGDGVADGGSNNSITARMDYTGGDFTGLAVNDDTGESQNKWG